MFSAIIVIITLILLKEINKLTFFIRVPIFTIILLFGIQFSLRKKDKKLKEQLIGLRKYYNRTSEELKNLYYYRPPSFKEGISSLTNFFGNKRFSYLSSMIQENKYFDNIAIKSDWEEVGIDLFETISLYSNWLQNLENLKDDHSHQEKTSELMNDYLNKMEKNYNDFKNISSFLKT